MTNSGRSSLADTGPVKIQPVCDRRLREVFLRFPWSIYANDPLWVPPLLVERREFLDVKKHPFFLHGTAALFLAYRGKQVVGRILASEDPRYNATHETRAGCFGMFESINDQAVASALLDAAAGWLRARGLNEIMGPIDYSTNYQCGLLVEGFETPPRVFMNHNPPYYADLLGRWGLAKAKDLYAWWFTDQNDLAKRWLRRAEHLAARAEISIRPFRLNDFHNEIMHCKAVYNEAWEKNWGFVRMTDEEFFFFARDLVKWVPPDLLLMAEVRGQVVGLAMTLPDFNEAFRPLNGEIFRWGLPIGYFQLKRNMRRIKAGRLIALGVLNAFRRRGVAELLILGTLSNARNNHGYTGAELSWTLEDNDLINRAIRTCGAELYKTFRIYQRPI